MSGRASKKALCVGINDYPYDGSDLNGCVNDAFAWAGALHEHFDFAGADVRVLTDAEATKANIISGLKDFLLAGAAVGDVLVFTNSSHGTYVADRSGDELNYDEALCPYDVADNLILDDELRELFAGVPNGVRLTVVSDSCHSGTVTRAAVGENIPLLTPDHRRVRFLSPALRGGKVLPNPWKAIPKRQEKFPESSMREVLLSGCTDKEYSYDALIEGAYHGAMTHCALRAMREAGYRLTYAQLHERVCYLLEETGYPQHPQLEGSARNKKIQLFT
jgi:hypothetical protein